MDARIFRDEPMNIRPQMLEIPLAERLTYDAGKNLFFVNFEGLDVQQRRGHRTHPAGGQRFAESRSGTRSTPSSITTASRSCRNWSTTTSAWSRRVVDRYYHDVTRYTSNTFLRVKIGEALQKRKLAPHLYETADEAEASLPPGGNQADA